MDERVKGGLLGSYSWKPDLIALNYPIEAILIRHLSDLGPSFAATAATLIAATRLPAHAVYAGLASLVAAGGVIKLHPPASHADQTFIVYWLQKMKTFAQLSGSHSWVKKWYAAATAVVTSQNSRRRAAIGVRTLLLKSASKKQKYVDSRVYCILIVGPCKHYKSRKW